MADSRCKYYKQKKQVSYDNGVTWYDVIPYEYQKGELYEMESQDCGYVPPVTEYRWVRTDDTICVEDEPGPTPTGYKFSAVYTGGTSYSAACDSNTTLTSGNTRPSGYGLTAMTSAVVGNCVTSIGKIAFRHGYSLTSITIPNSVTEIDSSAFEDCSSLTSVTIPNSVTAIYNSAFVGCSGMTSVSLGNGLTRIGSWAFSYCSSLTSVTIPDSVTEFENGAFAECSGLTSVTIGTGITTISANAFSGCTNVRRIIIPNNVTTIGERSFAYCTSLRSITINATTPPTLGTNAFSNTNNCPIYVPAASVNAYKSAENWSDYASRIHPIP